MARHSHPGGRFDVTHYEQKSMFDGMDSELRAPVGQHVLWALWNDPKTEVDRIYDVADHEAVGRQWHIPPIRVPALMCVIYQGATRHNDRGFYNTDLLHLAVAANVIEDLIPEMMWAPDAHIADRIIYRGKVFVPFQISPHGMLRDTHTTLSVDAAESNPEEYVNDPQILEWVRNSISPPDPYAPNKQRTFSTL